MQLNKQTDYAVRVLIYLAMAPKAQRCTVADMASTFGLSANNLAKIVNQFAHLGLITTIRGRHGGMTLNPSALDYRLGDLVEHFEPDTELADCEQPLCILSDDCAWRRILNGARCTMLQHMNQYRVRDLLHDRHWLEQVLQLEPLSAT